MWIIYIANKCLYLSIKQINVCEEQYNKYMSEIKFTPETVQLGDKCFDVQNNLKTCKK